MKQTTKIALLLLLTIGGASCAKHDFFDGDTITGKVGPEAYWEVKSAAVTAGDSMQFTAQYYSSKEKIDHSEAWYSIDETIEYTVICPWMASTTFSKTSSVTEHKRISQFIKSYPHDEAYWSDSLHAYTFTDYFPVSGTLSPVTWSQPTEYDSTKMLSYFGQAFIDAFQEEVHSKMQYEDYKKMYTGLTFMEDFLLYTDSAINPNSNEMEYFFKKDSTTGETAQWVLDSMDYYWNKVTFPDLIFNAGNSYYDVDYKRSYSIDAELRVFDVVGTYSKTVSKEISIN